MTPEQIYDAALIKWLTEKVNRSVGQHIRAIKNWKPA